MGAGDQVEVDEEGSVAVPVEVGDREAPGPGWLVARRRCTILLEATAKFPRLGSFEVSPEGEAVTQFKDGDFNDGRTT